MAKDTDSVAETAAPARHLQYPDQYPDGDYFGDDVKPFDIFLRSDGYVVRVPASSRMTGGYKGKPRRSIPPPRQQAAPLVRRHIPYIGSDMLPDTDASSR